jgi:hypothetical protein
MKRSPVGLSSGSNAVLPNGSVLAIAAKAFGGNGDADHPRYLGAPRVDASQPASDVWASV